MVSINVTLNINNKLYRQDPQGSELGKRIIRASIQLIDEIGFEQFTFKKLAKQIKSTETTIYRYFENKHQLLVYLLNWYWEWMKIRIDFNTMNIIDPVQQLKIAIGVIVDTAKRNTTIDFVDEDTLHRIVVAEGTKGYHTKAIDEENKDGFFLSYKTLCLKIADILRMINPEFPYPRTLASTMVETANNTLYFSKHLPRLTDIKCDEVDFCDNIIRMLEHLAFGALHYKGQASEVVPSAVVKNINFARKVQ